MESSHWVLAVNMGRSRIRCCTNHGPGEIVTIKWLLVTMIIALFLLIGIFTFIAVKLSGVVASAQPLATEATVAVHKIGAAVDDMHMEEWRQAIDDLDTVLKSDGVKLLTSGWVSLGLEAIMSTVSDVLGAVDLEALKVIVNAPTMNRMNRLITLADSGATLYLRDYAALFDAEQLRIAIEHGSNITVSLEKIVDAVTHGGLVLNIGKS